MTEFEERVYENTLAALQKEQDRNSALVRENERLREVLRSIRTQIEDI